MPDRIQRALDWLDRNPWALLAADIVAVLVIVALLHMFSVLMWGKT